MTNNAGPHNIQPNNQIAPTTSIGHVHLKVASINRALDFYHGVLGFEIVIRMGNSAAFL
ncbi:MAG: VOC family protein, partial [Chloroflexia bacterium]|nr:VOC family protein [Chloroflexia bacterium]